MAAGTFVYTAASRQPRPAGRFKNEAIPFAPGLYGTGKEADRAVVAFAKQGIDFHDTPSSRFGVPWHGLRFGEFRQEVQPGRFQEEGRDEEN